MHRSTITRARGTLAAAAAAFFTLAATASVGYATPSHSDTTPMGWGKATQTAELIGADAQMDDADGNSVSVSRDGSLAIVGAPNALGLDGAAYIYSTDGGSWTQVAELTSPDPGSLADFGNAVAMSANGSTVIVGAPFNGSGTAYVFRQTDGQWDLLARLTESDPGGDDLLGTSVALSASGNTAIVADYFHNGFEGSGYIFTATKTGWKQQAELNASDAAAGDYLGYFAALSGNGKTAVLGAMGKNGQRGAAYVFSKSKRVWTQDAELTAPDGSEGDQFGYSVAISGNGKTLAVGAPFHIPGETYIFARTTDGWTQAGEVTPKNGSGAWPGYAEALSAKGSVLVVGDPIFNDNQGDETVFVRAHGDWRERTSLDASDKSSQQALGSAVSISGDGSTILGGAPGVASTTPAGAAYVFARG